MNPPPSAIGRENTGNPRAKPAPRQKRRAALAALLIVAATVSMTGCYYDGGYYGSSRGYDRYRAPYSYYRGPSYPRYGKLKPKEKAYYGYGRHAGHPHGGPPGQLKKAYGHHGGHPHGGPPGQMKKYRY